MLREHSHHELGGSAQQGDQQLDCAYEHWEMGIKRDGPSGKGDFQILVVGRVSVILFCAGVVGGTCNLANLR